MITKNDYYIKNEATQIIALAPQNPESHYFMSLAYAYDGDMKSSYAELKEAKTLGLSEENYQTALDSFGLSKYLQIINAAKAGSHVITIPPKILSLMFRHNLTDVGLKKFSDDWAQLVKKQGAGIK